MKQKAPLRILHIVEKIERNNGVTAVVLNYFRHINHKAVMFDFITHGSGEQELENEILEGGGKIYVFPDLKIQNIKKCKSQIRTLLNQKNKYSIIHCHIPNMAFMYLKVAKEKNIPIRIIHSHNSQGSDKISKTIRNNVLHKIGISYANHFMTCSHLAARYLFGKQSQKAFLLHNAVDLKKYSYNKDIREKTRQELGLRGKIVIGHVGRFCKQKNHIFMLGFFQKLVKRNNNYRLLLIGSGELDEVIKETSKKMGIINYIIFAGVQTDIPKYLMAMDCFVLPSLFEGLPVSGVEAQVSGLTSFFSNKITGETKISPNASFLNLDKQVWADKIDKYVKNSEINKIDNYKEITDQGYNIEVEANKLLQYYQDRMRGLV